ncbi:Rieske (2Fe-2S) protein [uncultured Friedmanniella sp.]|uniref:Rieske (2Fe-2S) protein n=1 Tax=uncultured Friedmanniella sp. TaxID=335381 RepID=UPI0035CC0B5E
MCDDHPSPIGDGPADTATTRRRVLRAAGLLVAAGGGTAAFGACTADAESTPAASSAATTPSPASSPKPSGAASSSAARSPSASTSASSAAPKPSGPSAAIADVPVGGGVILKNADYVITQPSKGTYKAFSKICTHQRCPVTEVSDGAIICKCHGSKFSIEDGSVVEPPASKPLAESKVIVSGKEVYVEV